MSSTQVRRPLCSCLPCQASKACWNRRTVSAKTSDFPCSATGTPGGCPARFTRCHELEYAIVSTVASNAWLILLAQVSRSSSRYCSLFHHFCNATLPGLRETCLRLRSRCVLFFRPARLPQSRAPQLRLFSNWWSLYSIE